MTLDQSWNPDGFWNWPSDAAMREEILIARRLGPERDPRPRQGRGAAQALLGRPARRARHGRRAEQLGRAGRGDARGLGDGAARHGAPRLQPPVDLLVGALQRAVGPAVEGRGSARPQDRPARDAATGWSPRYASRSSSTPPASSRTTRPAAAATTSKTDLNSWHMYLPGWRGRRRSTRPRQDLPGSSWNFVGGREAGRRSRCSTASAATSGATRARPATWTGASTTTRMNEFRRHPKVGGWLYTEHHDVINEWNGYVRADRSAKETGLSELVPDDAERPGTRRSTWPSAPTRRRRRSPASGLGAALGLVPHRPAPSARARAAARPGRPRRPSAGCVSGWTGQRRVPFAPWPSQALEPGRGADAGAAGGRRSARGSRTRPAASCSATSRPSWSARALRRLATSVDGTGASARGPGRGLSAACGRVRSWSGDGRPEANGAGSGFFEYRLAWPKDLRAEAVAGAAFLAELGAKEPRQGPCRKAARSRATSCAGRGTHDPAQPQRLPDDERPRSRAPCGWWSTASRPVASTCPTTRPTTRGSSARAEARRQAPAGRGGVLRDPGLGHGPGAALRAAAARASSSSAWRWTRRCRTGWPCTGKRGRYPLDPSLVLTLRR